MQYNFIKRVYCSIRKQWIEETISKTFKYLYEAQRYAHENKLELIGRDVIPVDDIHHPFKIPPISHFLVKNPPARFNDEVGPRSLGDYWIESNESNYGVL